MSAQGFMAREIYMADTSREMAPAFLKWSEVAVTFDTADRPNNIPQLDYFPLVISPIVSNTRPTKVLMDGRSSLNLLYVETYDAM